ncbi:3270_t:CDS:2, partial [Entrophospora sp. SA101]
NIEASDRLSAEDFIRIDNEIQEFGNVEITDEEIISHVRPTAESEPEDELSIVNQKITTKEALESLNIVLSYIQDPPENLTFEFKHINSIKAIKNHISKHTASKKNKAHWIIIDTSSATGEVRELLLETMVNLLKNLLSWFTYDLNVDCVFI